MFRSLQTVDNVHSLVAADGFDRFVLKIECCAMQQGRRQKGLPLLGLRGLVSLRRLH